MARTRRDAGSDTRRAVKPPYDITGTIDDVDAGHPGNPVNHFAAG
jgi:hypothetical protein